MEKLKINIEKYKIKDEKLCKFQFQEIAKKIIEDFNIGAKYRPLIFKKAKQNSEFLENLAINLKEKANYKGEDIKTYNRLFIFLLTKK